LHFPPLTTSLQAQSIPRLILAKAFRMLLSTLKADNRKMGSEERTDFTRAVQPALFRNLPFQGFKRATALSMKGWRSARLSLPSDRGRPRYLSLYLCSPLAYISKQKLQHTLVAIFGKVALLYFHW
jgi:hypothetical protein